MPSKKKKYNARFPPARIKKIMQTDDEVGKVAAAVPVIISRALELFVESLITKTNEITQARNAKTLTTSHLKQCILYENKFDFLKDLVATVPDVQPDDDASNSGPVLSPPCPAAIAAMVNEQNKPGATPTRKYKPRKPRIRKSSTVNNNNNNNNNAGPSHSGAEGSDDDDDTDDDDEGEDSESSGSQGSHVVQSPSAISPVVYRQPSFPVPAQVLPTFAAASNDDEDYDS